MFHNGARGTLTFQAGTVDATNIILGNMTADMNTRRDTTGDSGTINVNGTANLVVGAGGIILGKMPSTGTSVIGRSAGTLNIRNTATVTVNGAIDAGGTPSVVSGNAVGSYSTISMSGGTLDMTGHAIGAVQPINNFTVSGGSINNLASLTVNTFQVNSNYSLTSGPLIA